MFVLGGTVPVVDKEMDETILRFQIPLTPSPPVMSGGPNSNFK